MSIGEAVDRYLQRPTEKKYGREFYQRLDEVIPFEDRGELLINIESLVLGLIPPDRTYLSEMKRAEALLRKSASYIQTNAPTTTCSSSILWNFGRL